MPRKFDESQLDLFSLNVRLRGARAFPAGAPGGDAERRIVDLQEEAFRALSRGDTTRARELLAQAEGSWRQIGHSALGLPSSGALEETPARSTSRAPRALTPAMLPRYGEALARLEVAREQLDRLLSSERLRPLASPERAARPATPDPRDPGAHLAWPRFSSLERGYEPPVAQAEVDRLRSHLDRLLALGPDVERGRLIEQLKSHLREAESFGYGARYVRGIARLVANLDRTGATLVDNPAGRAEALYRATGDQLQDLVAQIAEIGEYSDGSFARRHATSEGRAEIRALLERVSRKARDLRGRLGEANRTLERARGYDRELARRQKDAHYRSSSPLTRLAPDEITRELQLVRAELRKLEPNSPAGRRLALLAQDLEVALALARGALAPARLAQLPFSQGADVTTTVGGETFRHDRLFRGGRLVPGLLPAGRRSPSEPLAVDAIRALRERQRALSEAYAQARSPDERTRITAEEHAVRLRLQTLERERVSAQQDVLRGGSLGAAVSRISDLGHFQRRLFGHTPSDREIEELLSDLGRANRRASVAGVGEYAYLLTRGFDVLGLAHDPTELKSRSALEQDAVRRRAQQLELLVQRVFSNEELQGSPRRGVPGLGHLPREARYELGRSLMTERFPELIQRAESLAEGEARARGLTDEDALRRARDEAFETLGEYLHTLRQLERSALLRLPGLGSRGPEDELQAEVRDEADLAAANESLAHGESSIEGTSRALARAREERFGTQSEPDYIWNLQTMLGNDYRSYAQELRELGYGEDAVGQLLDTFERAESQGLLVSETTATFRRDPRVRAAEMGSAAFLGSGPHRMRSQRYDVESGVWESGPLPRWGLREAQAQAEQLGDVVRGIRGGPFAARRGDWTGDPELSLQSSVALQLKSFVPNARLQRRFGRIGAWEEEIRQLEGLKKLVDKGPLPDDRELRAAGFSAELLRGLYWSPVGRVFPLPAGTNAHSGPNFERNLERLIESRRRAIRGMGRLISSTRGDLVPASAERIYLGRDPGGARRYGRAEVMSEVKPALSRPAAILGNYEPTSADAFRMLASRHALYPAASEEPGSFGELMRASLDPRYRLTTTGVGRAHTQQLVPQGASGRLVGEFGTLGWADIAREIARRAREPISSEVFSRALARNTQSLVGNVLESGRHLVGGARAVNTLIEPADVSLMRGNTEYPALGNPFGMAQGFSREQVIELFGDYLQRSPAAQDELRRLKGARRERGGGRVRKFGCHCWPLPCHCDLLAEIVNQGERFEELSFGDVADRLVQAGFVRERRDESGRVIERQGDLGTAFRGLSDFYRLSRAAFSGQGGDWRRWRALSERPGTSSFAEAQLFLGERLAGMPREARESLIANADPLAFVARTAAAGLLPETLRDAVMDLTGQVERARHEAATLAQAESEDPRALVNELYDVAGIPESADLQQAVALIGDLARANAPISRGGHLAPLLMEGTPLWESLIAPHLRGKRDSLPGLLTSRNVGEAVPAEVLGEAESRFGGLLQEGIIVRSALAKLGVDPAKVRLTPKESLYRLFPELSSDEVERYLGQFELLRHLTNAIGPRATLPEKVRYEPGLHDQGPLRWLRRPGPGERGPLFRETLGTPYQAVGPQSGEMTASYLEHLYQLVGIRFPKSGESLTPEGLANRDAFVRALGGLNPRVPGHLAEAYVERLHRTITGLQPFYYDLLGFAQKAWEHNDEGGVPLDDGSRVKLGDYAQRTLDDIARIVEPERVKSLVETKAFLETRLKEAEEEMGRLRGTPELPGPLANIPLSEWFPPGEPVGRLSSGEELPGLDFANWERYLGRYRRDETGGYLRDESGELVPFARTPEVGEPELRALKGPRGEPLWGVPLPNPRIVAQVKGPLGLSYDELLNYYGRARPGRDRLTMGRALASVVRRGFEAESGVQSYLRHRYTGSDLSEGLRELLGELAKSPGQEGGMSFETVLRAGIDPYLLETPSIPELRLALEGGWWQSDHPNYWERYQGVNEQLAEATADSYAGLRQEALELRAALAQPPVYWPYATVTDKIGEKTIERHRTVLPWEEPERSPISLLDAAGVLGALYALSRSDIPGRGNVSADDSRGRGGVLPGEFQPWNWERRNVAGAGRPSSYADNPELAEFRERFRSMGEDPRRAARFTRALLGQAAPNWFRRGGKSPNSIPRAAVSEMLGALGYEGPTLNRMMANFRGGLRRDAQAYTADSKIYWELARDLGRFRPERTAAPLLRPNPNPPVRRVLQAPSPTGLPAGPPAERKLLFTPLAQVADVVRRYGTRGYGLYNVGGALPADFPHTFPDVPELASGGEIPDLSALGGYLSRLAAGGGQAGLARVRESLRIGSQAGPLILTVASELQAQALAGILGRVPGSDPSFHFRQGNTKIERPLKALPPAIAELSGYRALESGFREEFPAGAPRRSAESLFEDALRRSGINPSNEQVRAILSPAKDLAVIAPSGTGKTTVAALRSAAMLIGRVQGGSQTAWRLLNIAFNRTAARDLGLEAYGVLPPEIQKSLQRVDQQTIGRTIHSLAESAVLPSLARYRRGQKSPAFVGHEKYVPYGEELPRIIGTRFQVEALARVMSDIGIIPPPESYPDDSGRESPDWFLGDVAHEARSYLAEISWAKMNNLFPDEYARHLEESGKLADPWYSRAAVLYDEYQGQKAEANLLDFDDLLLLFYRLLTEDPWTFAKYNGASEAGGYDHLLVDEFQDVRPLEWLTIAQMRRPDGRLVVLGDPEQAIYTTFREAVGSLEGVADLGVFAGDPETVELKDNYRSGRAITAALRGLSGREWERSYFDRAGEIHVYPTLTPEAQYDLIAGLVQGDIARGIPPQNIAVSARVSSFLYQPGRPDSGLFGALKRRGIPAILEPSEQQKLDMSLAELLRFQLLKSLEEGRAVNVGNIFKYKGRGFESQYILDAREGGMPIRHAGAKMSQEEETVERRIAHVGFGRAMKKLVLTYPLFNDVVHLNNMQLHQPSRFIGSAKASFDRAVAAGEVPAAAWQVHPPREGDLRIPGLGANLGDVLGAEFFGGAPEIAGLPDAGTSSEAYGDWIRQTFKEALALMPSELRSGVGLSFHDLPAAGLSPGARSPRLAFPRRPGAWWEKAQGTGLSANVGALAGPGRPTSFSEHIAFTVGHEAGHYVDWAQSERRAPGSYFDPNTPTRQGLTEVHARIAGRGWTQVPSAERDRLNWRYRLLPHEARADRFGIAFLRRVLSQRGIQPPHPSYSREQVLPRLRAAGIANEPWVKSFVDEFLAGAPAGLPAIPANHVRLYRGENQSLGKRHQLERSDWLWQTIAESGQVAAQGRWWSRDPRLVWDAYSNDVERGRAHEYDRYLLYQDVPADVARRVHLAAPDDLISPEARRARRFSGDFAHEWFLPEEYAPPLDLGTPYNQIAGIGPGRGQLYRGQRVPEAQLSAVLGDYSAGVPLLEPEAIKRAAQAATRPWGAYTSEGRRERVDFGRASSGVFPLTREALEQAKRIVQEAKSLPEPLEPSIGFRYGTLPGYEAIGQVATEAFLENYGPSGTRVNFVRPEGYVFPEVTTHAHLGVAGTSPEPSPRRSPDDILGMGLMAETLGKPTLWNILGEDELGELVMRGWRAEMRSGRLRIDPYMPFVVTGDPAADLERFGAFGGTSVLGAPTSRGTRLPPSAAATGELAFLGLSGISGGRGGDQPPRPPIDPPVDLIEPGDESDEESAATRIARAAAASSDPAEIAALIGQAAGFPAAVRDPLQGFLNERLAGLGGSAAAGANPAVSGRDDIATIRQQEGRGAEPGTSQVFGPPPQPPAAPEPVTEARRPAPPAGGALTTAEIAEIQATVDPAGAGTSTSPVSTTPRAAPNAIKRASDLIARYRRGEVGLPELRTLATELQAESPNAAAALRRVASERPARTGRQRYRAAQPNVNFWQGAFNALRQAAQKAQPSAGEREWARLAGAGVQQLKGSIGGLLGEAARGRAMGEEFGATFPLGGLARASAPAALGAYVARLGYDVRGSDLQGESVTLRLARRAVSERTNERTNERRSERERGEVAGAGATPTSAQRRAAAGSETLRRALEGRWTAEAANLPERQLRAQIDLLTGLPNQTDATVRQLAVFQEALARRFGNAPPPTDALVVGGRTEAARRAYQAGENELPVELAGDYAQFWRGQPADARGELRSGLRSGIAQLVADGGRFVQGVTNGNPSAQERERFAGVVGFAQRSLGLPVSVGEFRPGDSHLSALIGAEAIARGVPGASDEAAGATDGVPPGATPPPPGGTTPPPGDTGGGAGDATGRARGPRTSIKGSWVGAERAVMMHGLLGLRSAEARTGTRFHDQIEASYRAENDALVAAGRPPRYLMEQPVAGQVQTGPGTLRAVTGKYDVFDQETRTLTELKSGGHYNREQLMSYALLLEGMGTPVANLEWRTNARRFQALDPKSWLNMFRQAPPTERMEWNDAARAQTRRGIEESFKMMEEMERIAPEVRRAGGAEIGPGRFSSQLRDLERLIQGVYQGDRGGGNESEPLRVALTRQNMIELSRWLTDVGAAGSRGANAASVPTPRWLESWYAANAAGRAEAVGGWTNIRPAEARSLAGALRNLYELFRVPGVQVDPALRDRAARRVVGEITEWAGARLGSRDPGLTPPSERAGFPFGAAAQSQAEGATRARASRFRSPAEARAAYEWLRGQGVNFEEFAARNPALAADMIGAMGGGGGGRGTERGRWEAAGDGGPNRLYSIGRGFTRFGWEAWAAGSIFGQLEGDFWQRAVRTDQAAGRFLINAGVTENGEAFDARKRQAVQFARDLGRDPEWLATQGEILETASVVAARAGIGRLGGEQWSTDRAILAGKPLLQMSQVLGIGGAEGADLALTLMAQFGQMDSLHRLAAQGDVQGIANSIGNFTDLVLAVQQSGGDPGLLITAGKYMGPRMREAGFGGATPAEEGRGLAEYGALMVQASQANLTPRETGAALRGMYELMTRPSPSQAYGLRRAFQPGSIDQSALPSELRMANPPSLEVLQQFIGEQSLAISGRQIRAALALQPWQREGETLQYEQGLTSARLGVLGGQFALDTEPLQIRQLELRRRGTTLDIAQTEARLAYAREHEPRVLAYERFQLGAAERGLARSEVSLNFGLWQQQVLAGTPNQAAALRVAGLEWQSLGLAANRSQVTPGLAPIALSDTGANYGLAGEEFVAGLKHNRAQAFFGRSRLLSGAAYEESLDYLDEQKDFFERRAQVEETARAIQEQQAREQLSDQKAALGYQRTLQDEEHAWRKTVYEAELAQLGLRSEALEAQREIDTAELKYRQDSLPVRQRELELAQLALGQQQQEIPTGQFDAQGREITKPAYLLKQDLDRQDLLARLKVQQTQEFMRENLLINPATNLPVSLEAIPGLIETVRGPDGEVSRVKSIPKFLEYLRTRARADEGFDMEQFLGSVGLEGESAVPIMAWARASLTDEEREASIREIEGKISAGKTTREVFGRFMTGVTAQERSNQVVDDQFRVAAGYRLEDWEARKGELTQGLNALAGTDVGGAAIATAIAGGQALGALGQIAITTAALLNMAGLILQAIRTAFPVPIVPLPGATPGAPGTGQPPAPRGPAVPNVGPIPEGPPGATPNGAAPRPANFPAGSPEMNSEGMRYAALAIRLAGVGALALGFVSAGSTSLDEAGRARLRHFGSTPDRVEEGLARERAAVERYGAQPRGADILDLIGWNAMVEALSDPRGYWERRTMSPAALQALDLSGNVARQGETATLPDDRSIGKAGNVTIELHQTISGDVSEDQKARWQEETLRLILDALARYRDGE